MDKEQLRLKYKSLRKELTPDAIDEQSLSIANQCLKLPIWQKSYFHLFLPIQRQKEVDTYYLLHILQGRDKNVVVPKTNPEDNTLSNYLLTDATTFSTSDIGITEPNGGIPIDTSLLEVAFIPLLAYDRYGNRIGYGKGYYDRFLSTCRPELLKIGLSFFAPEIEPISIEGTDIPLDYCVSHKELYHFRH